MLTDKQKNLYLYYLAQQLANEVILTCAKAEGYVNEGDDDPWPKIPWDFDVTALVGRIRERLAADPHFHDLVDDVGERAVMKLLIRE